MSKAILEPMDLMLRVQASKAPRQQKPNKNQAPVDRVQALFAAQAKATREKEITTAVATSTGKALGTALGKQLIATAEGLAMIDKIIRKLSPKKPIESRFTRGY